MNIWQINGASTLSLSRPNKAQNYDYAIAIAPDGKAWLYNERTISTTALSWPQGQARAVVCDGVGVGPGAMQAAMQIAVSLLRAPAFNTLDAMRHWVEAEHQSLRQNNQADTMLNAATTLSWAECLPDGQALLLNIGDSRIYHRDTQQHWQALTVDQSPYRRDRLFGQMDDTMWRHYRHYPERQLTQALGSLSTHNATAQLQEHLTWFDGPHPDDPSRGYSDLQTRQMQAGEVLCLASDGYWDGWPAETLLPHWPWPADLGEAHLLKWVEDFVPQTMGRDNASFVAVCWE